MLSLSETAELTQAQTSADQALADLGRRWPAGLQYDGGRRCVMTTGGAKPGQATGPLEGKDRLDSWKEIASYLRRGVRTVTRWEREQGLPVHRSKTGTVYAYKSELDVWWSSHGQQVESGQPAAAMRPAFRLHRWRMILVAGAGMILVAGLASFALRRSFRPEPKLV